MDGAIQTLDEVAQDHRYDSSALQFDEIQAQAYLVWMQSCPQGRRLPLHNWLFLSPAMLECMTVGLRTKFCQQAGTCFYSREHFVLKGMILISHKQSDRSFGFATSFWVGLPLSAFPKAKSMGLVNALVIENLRSRPMNRK